MGWGGGLTDPPPLTVPQEGHNFEFSENDLFHLISYFGPKRHMSFDKTAIQRKKPKILEQFLKK